MHLITRFYSVLWSFSLGNFLVADKILKADKYLCSVLLWIFALFHSFSLKSLSEPFVFTMLSMESMLGLSIYLLFTLYADHMQRIILRVVSRAVSPLFSSGTRCFIFCHLRLAAWFLCLVEVGAMEPLTASELAPLIKKLPLLTDSNYADWAFRLKVVLVFLGLGYLYLSPRESSLPNVLQAVVSSSGERSRNARGQFVSSSSSSGSVSSASSENKDQEQQRDQAETLTSSTENSAVLVDNKNRHLGYSILIASLSEKFLSLVRNVPLGDLETVFHTITSFFVVRTNAERFALADELATATMGPDEDFLSFCARLEYVSALLNPRGGW